MPVSRHVVKASSDSALSKSKVEAFSRTMTAVEALRSVQVERLLTSMQINRLPSGISDPNMLPLLNPTVRTAVEAFSLQAKEIVEAHGLDTMEFNDMLAKVESDSSFRRTVQQHASVMNRSI